jgi:hypothetical protein
MLNKDPAMTKATCVPHCLLVIYPSSLQDILLHKGFLDCAGIV